MSTELIQDSELYQLWVQAAEARGREQGIEQGITNALRDATRLALDGRFNPLPDDMLQALEQASNAQLRAVLAHVGVETLEQLRARLEQQP